MPVHLSFQKEHQMFLLDGHFYILISLIKNPYLRSIIFQSNCLKKKIVTVLV